MPINLNIVIIAIGMFGFMIFMVKRELFVHPKYSKIILSVSLLLLILVYVLPVFDTFKNRPINVLKLPILTLFLYRILRAFFKKVNKREPKDTFWMMHWEKGIWKDTVFNISFGIIMIVFMILVASKKI